MRDSSQPEDRAGANAEHERRVGEILNDLLDRERQGNPVHEAYVRAQYPDLADELLAHLDLVSHLKRPGDPVQQLTAQGVLAESPDGRGVATLGSYRIISFLGRGGMGIVLQAHEDSLNRPVALKLLRPELAQDPTALRRFAREAKAAGSLKHPNIVTVYAVGEHRGTHFLAMEYVAGSTLADLIREQAPLPTQMVRGVFRQILLGLSAAHSADLIHRDVKSSNILLDGCSVSEPSGESPPPERDASSRMVKIADFGLARVSGAQTRMTLPESILGTPEYMSPEQARGDESTDHRTDLYSAGVVLYEMLTGRTPFKADKASAVVHRILNEEPPDPRSLSDGVDAGLASLALRLMAKRPEDRFDSADESIAVLDAGQRVASLERRRRRVRGMVLGSAALVLIGSMAWMAKHNGSAPDVIESRSLVTNVWSTPDDPQEHYRRKIWADYSDGRTKQVFYEFRERAGKVSEAALVDFDGDGRNDGVVAGIQGFVDANCLLMFDLDGKVAWSMDLTPERGIDWPDIDGPPVRWGFRTLRVGDVDRVAGDELIVVAGHRTQYPRRISVVEPTTQAIRSTFWHMGNLDEILIVDDFPFEDDQKKPAIVARGVSNKLDGFGDPSPRPYTPREGESPPRTDHLQVPILIILDPTNMDGLGPPRTDRIGLPPATPWAYAYLDLSTLVVESSRPGTPYLVPAAGLRRLQRWFAPKDSAQDAVIEVSVVRLDGSVRREAHWAVLVLSHDLSLRGVIPGGLQEPPPGGGGWEGIWHPVVQRGRYLVD